MIEVDAKQVRCWAGAQLHALWAFFEPDGVSLRLGIGIYMIVTGAARLLTGNSPSGVGFLSSRFYGLLMVIAALSLLITTREPWRRQWSGRIACICCAVLWIFIIINAWPAQAWVSISGAVCFVLFLGNEVRIRVC